MGLVRPKIEITPKGIKMTFAEMVDGKLTQYPLLTSKELLKIWNDRKKN